MDMRSVKHEMVAQEWRQRILAQRESGLSVKKWCAGQGIREQKYYYWLHVLKSELINRAKVHTPWQIVKLYQTRRADTR